MATVTGLTAARTLEIEAGLIVDAEVDGTGHLVLTKFDNSTIDAGPVVTSNPAATTTSSGIIELATNAEVATGTDAVRAVTPAGLASLVSSDTAKGIVELATNAEVATGTDATRAVTPAGLASLVSTSTAKGIVELATDAEAATGTDTTRAVTPANMKPLLDAKQPLDSDLTAIAAIAPANDDVVQRKSGAWTNRTMAQVATDLVATNQFGNMFLGTAQTNTAAKTYNAGTLLDKGEIVFDVKAYSATGNGSTDDTTAVQAAITACSSAGGGTVYFPAGTYLCSSLTVPSKVLLRGASSKAAMIKKSANGVLISISGPSTDATGATHIRYSGIENLELNGNALTGNLLRLYYADNLVFRDIFLTNNSDTAIDAVEFWDSKFYNMVVESCGGAADSTSPNVRLRNSAASSGFGYSGDNINQIHFFGCRFENFFNGAIRIEQGTNNTNTPNGIYIDDCKMETSQMRGGAHLNVDASAKHVHVNHLYCYAGGFYSGYSTAQNIIVWSAQASSLENVLISNGATATINAAIDLYSGASSVAILRNVIGSYTTAPTGAHIYYEGSSTADVNIQNCFSNTGTQYSGTAITKHMNPSFRLVAGAVSDASFTRTPPDGTMAVDTTNSKIYVRIGGAWKSVTVA